MTRSTTCTVRGVAIATALVLLPACAAEQQADANTVTTRDSAGVAIVESSAAVWRDTADAWWVDTPTLTIGEEEGDAAYLLDRVVGATRLADGTIVVADGGTNEVRFYDANGRFVRRAGGTGRGPGEFEYLRALHRCSGGDSLAAFNINWQMSVFSPMGAYGRQLDIRPPGQSSPYELACAPTGTLVVTGWGNAMDGPRIGFYRSMTKVWILDASGREVASLGEHLGSERMGQATGSGPHPFGRSTVIAAGRDAIYLGDGTRFEVHRYDETGRLTRVQRAPVEDLTIPTTLLEAYRARQLARVSEAQRPQMQRYLDELPLLDGLPAFTRLMIDADGSLWARRFRVPGDTMAARWGVFAPDGAFLGHVTMPSRFELLEIGMDYVLGVARDDADVQRVQLRRFNRTAAPRDRT